MFTVENFKLVYVKNAYYLTKTWDQNLKVNLLKLYFKMFLSQKNSQTWNQRVP